MHQLGLSRTTRREPFAHLGGHAVSEFLDLTVDGVRLLPSLEQSASEHFDVVTPLTYEFPPGGVGLLDAALGTDPRWGLDLGAEDGGVPIYVCPVDYDLLCGGIVAQIARTDHVVRIFNFRHTSTDEPHNSRVTARLRDIDYSFDRAQFDDVLGPARIEFADQARMWFPPDNQAGTMRRWVRRIRRRLPG